MTLPHRIEEYVQPDGRRFRAIVMGPHDILYKNMETGESTRARLQVALVATVEQILTAYQALGPTPIPQRYFVGTAQHETRFATNEWDTEVSGFQSVGLFQIGREEAHGHGGYLLADMLDLRKATACLKSLAEDHRLKIRAAAGLSPAQPDPPDFAAWLAVAHNHGNGFATGWIARHGLNWAAYKAMRPDDRIIPYAHDCVTGGPFYPQVAG